MGAMVRDCPICETAKFSKTIMSLPANGEATLSRTTYDYAECTNCSTIYIRSDVPDADHRAQYDDNTKQFAGGVYRNPDHILLALEYLEGAIGRVSLAIKTEVRNLKILEIGAGLAWMSRAAKGISKSAFTVAHDLSDECIQETKAWVDYYAVGDLNHPHIIANKPYDLISLTHVIEHVPSPKETLKTARNLLAPNGRVFITAPHRPENWETGDSDAFQAWSYNHVPAHLTYFSERSLRQIAKMCDLDLDLFYLGENGQSFEANLRQA